MVTIGLAANAGVITSFEKIGPHFRVFTYEKNENNQNILIAYTQLGENCQIQKKNGQPVFDFYWLMDRQRYKPVAPLIRKRIRQRLKVLPSQDSDSFEVQMKDLSELETKLPSIAAKVQSYRDQDGHCEVKATLPTPENPMARFRLQTVYAKAEKTWNPFDRQLVSVELKGTVEKTGAPFSQEFQAKKK